jgi:exosortase
VAIASAPSSSSSTSEQPGWSPLQLAAFAVVLLALGLAYAPSLIYLSKIWASESNYSHGYLVVPAALLILWLRRDSFDQTKVAPSIWGWVLLVAVLGLRALLYERNEQWMEDATFPLAVAAVALAFGGWHMLRWSLPAIIFLGFMLPLPNRVNVQLAYPLQRLATIGSCNLLETMGLPAVAEGNVVIISGQRLEVARACNGLSMMLSFLALLTAAAILVQRPLLDRIVLLVTAIPIALLVNILRITITALCFNFFGTDELRLPLGIQLPHDWSGWLMMPMGLILVWLELQILSWLVVEEQEPTEQTAAFDMIPAGPAYRPMPAKKAEKPEKTEKPEGAEGLTSASTDAS